MGFIEQIAPIVQKYAPKYNIKVCSPIIAQAVLESASGTSELAKNAHNYFGLKYRPNRCPTASGIYYKIGSEQNSDGSYVSSTMQWMKFSSMEMGVQGYFDFINISNYKNLKGVTDPKKYLENIKVDGYATSLNYVENVINVIKKYNLTKYDTANNNLGGVEKEMKINVHAGHNPDGKIACGAIGLIKESTEARRVKDLVIAKLRNLGHTVFDCTCENGSNQNDVLRKIVAKCNANVVDLDLSIHFNSGVNDLSGNGRTTGTEILTYSASSRSNSYAKNIVNEVAKLGFKNRGLKYNPSLYVLKHTKNPACLIEVCFVGDADDVRIYDADKVATAIVKGITGVSVSGGNTTLPPTDSGSTSKPPVTPIVPNGLKYSVGQTVTYSSCYRSSTDGANAAISCNPHKTGKITKVLTNGARNPYLIDNGRCWVNDGDIRSVAGEVNNTPSQNVGTPKPQSNVNSIIKKGQKHAVDFTGFKIAVDGIAGANTEKMKSRVLQRALNKDYKARISEDGIFGTNSKRALGNHYVKKGEKQWLVTAAEILMELNGVDPNGVEKPGVYGTGLVNAAKKFFGDDGMKITASEFLKLI